MLAIATAAVIALLQLRNALEVRRRQAQPFVVLYDEPSGPELTVIELVVRNFGSTPACDVRILASPPLERTPHKNKTTRTGVVRSPEVIRTLVPGQEWRTVWDHAASRAKLSILNRSDVVVTFEDRDWKIKLSSSTNLDWSVNADRFYVEDFGIHHAAKALRSIDETLAKLPEPGRQGISAWVRDGHARDVERLENDRQAHAWFEGPQQTPELAKTSDPDELPEQLPGTQPANHVISVRRLGTFTWCCTAHLQVNIDSLCFRGRVTAGSFGSGAIFTDSTNSPGTGLRHALSATDPDP